jgi:hypothetical protein
MGGITSWGRHVARIALPAPRGKRLRFAGRALSGPAAEARPGRVVRGPAPPHAPDDPEQLRRELDGRLEPGVPVAVPLGFEGGEAMVRNGKELLSQFYHQFACTLK